MRNLILISLMAGSLFAQTSPPSYTALYEATLAGTAGVATLQQPASPTRSLVLIGIQMYSSVACVVSLESAGPASGTATPVTSTSPSVSTPSAAVFYADSNAAAPTRPINKYRIGAGGTVTVPFTDVRGLSSAVIGRSVGQNVTLRSNAISGDVAYTFFWREE